MKINKQSNWYTILYIVVLVVVVGTALDGCYESAVADPEGNYVEITA